MSWFDLNENPSYPRPAHWILILAEVFLCHPVHVFLCSVEGYFTYASADYSHIEGGGRIADVKRDPGVSNSVSVL